MLVPVNKSVAVIAKLASESPEAANQLAHFALYETFYDLVDVHRGRIEPIAKRLDEQLRTQLVRGFVAARAAGEDVSGYLEVAKAMATPDDPSTEWWDARDERGRFVSQLSGGNAGEKYNDLQQRIDELQRRGKVAPGTPIKVEGWSPNEFNQTVQDENGEPTDQPYAKEIAAVVGEKGSAIKWTESRPTDFEPATLKIHPEDMPPPPRPRAQSGAIDFGQTFIGYDRSNQPGKPSLVREGQLKTNLRNVTERRPAPDRRAYRQLAVAGRAVRATSGPGSPGMAVGTVAQLAGELGPQAESVLAPGVRRTAYRYRGTEKTPDPQLRREMDQVNRELGSSAQELLGRYTTAGPKSALPAGKQPQLRPDAAGLAPGSLARNTRGDWHLDQQALGARGDTAVGYFIPRIPDPDRASLSIAAGRVPPSQGVIINAEGDVVSEAMGYGSDHYLPFDLKNLGQLNGGQYVRTRVAGGPTTEDVYTGLLTGTRQLQVASNSGVFTVEFDPSLRGGRRYSDKARQMVTRYQALLDRIWESQQGKKPIHLSGHDISAEDMREVETKARNASMGEQDIYESTKRRLLEEKRQEAMLAQPTEDEIREAAGRQVETELRQRGQAVPTDQHFQAMVDQRADELWNAQKENRVEALKLDGEGYRRALESLQEEYPYFIRDVRFEDLRGFTTSRGHERGSGMAPRRSRRGADVGFVRTAQGHLTANETASASGKEREAPQAEAKPKEAAPAAQAAPSAKQTGSVRFGLRPFEAKPAEDRSEELSYGLQGALGAASTAILPRYADPAESANPDYLLRAGDPGQWLKAYSFKHGGIGSAAAKLAKEGSPEEIDQLDRLVDETQSKIEAERSSGYPVNQTELEGLAKLKEAVAQLKSERGVLPTTESPVTSAPNPENPQPWAFPEIQALSNQPENYSGFRSRQAGTPFEQAVKELEGLDPADQAKKVADATKAYNATIAWADANPADKPPNALVDWHRDAVAMRDRGEEDPRYIQLANLHLAWSFLSQEKLHGGGAGPKAVPGPNGARGVGFVPPEREKAAKRFVVHPPGSPLAVEFAKRRRTLSRPGSRG